MPSATFKFGLEERHELMLVCGLLGKEEYFADGKLVASYWSMRPTAVRRFQAIGHDIEIRIKVGLKAVSADAFVNGELKAQDLFSEVNMIFKQKPQQKSLFGRAAIWIVLVLVFFIIFKSKYESPNSSQNTDLPSASRVA